jgi:uncharacterized protein (TIGR00369 family)
MTGAALSELPPYARWLGVRLEPRADGDTLFVMPPSDHLEGRPGFLHGGAIGGLLEIAAIGTLMIATAREETPVRIKPVTVTFDFMRGGRSLDTVASARIVRLGTRIANVEAQAWQDDPARPIASARMTLTLFRDAAAG